MQPWNRYAFMELLSGTVILSMKRNGALESLARMIRENPVLRDDDNVYLSAVEAQWRAAQEEQRRRRGEAKIPPGGSDSEASAKVGERAAPDAARLICTGMRLTVDGCLGLVVCMRITI